MRYLWFSFELQRYSCAECDGNVDQVLITEEDNEAITTSLEDLFLALSKLDPTGEFDTRHQRSLTQRFGALV